MEALTALKRAENLLNDIFQDENGAEIIAEEVESWEIDNIDSPFPEVILKIVDNYKNLEDIYVEKENLNVREALELVVFHTLHDVVFPKTKSFLYSDDIGFFHKCKFLHDLNVSVVEFGAKEDFDIPLTAAIVELSVIDRFKSPKEKMECLYRTYDLVFAEIKTALVSLISQYSDKENDIPIINNSDIVPVIMMVIIKSKLHYFPSNLFYIKSLYVDLPEQPLLNDILTTFDTALTRLAQINLKAIIGNTRGIIRDIGVEEYIRITSLSDEEKKDNKTPVDQENQRILNLITTSTNEME